MTRKHFTVGIFIIITGLILAGLGLLNHASTNVVWDHGIKLDMPYQQTLPLKKFDQLNADLHDYDLTIQQGDQATIKIVGTTHTKPTITQRNHKLTLTNSAFQLGMQLGGATQHIVITVTNPLQLKSLTGSLGDSDLLLSSRVTTKKLALALNDGDLTAHHLQVGSGSLESHDGDVKLIDSHLQNLALTSNDGDFDVHGSTIIGGHLITRDGDQTFAATTFKKTVTLQTHDGDLAIHDANRAWGYQLSAKDGHIRWFDQTKTTTLTHNAQSTPQLQVATHDGTITID